MSGRGEALNLQAAMTPAQFGLLRRIVAKFHGKPSAGAIVVAFDLSSDRTLSIGTTTSSAPLHFTAALMVLRHAAAMLREQSDFPQHAAMVEAVRTALPFLEAVGAAEPLPGQEVVQ
jgi:hypothetical protein